jgi:acyl-homoserine-lactone acylase
LADIPLALLALQDAASELQATKGTLDVTWGEIARLRRGKTDLPGNGAGTALGVFREIVYEPDEDGKFKSFSGDTYIALVEFSQPVRAQVLTTYGNASQHPISEIRSQLPLAAKQQLRPAWRMLDEIEANLAMREILRR